MSRRRLRSLVLVLMALAAVALAAPPAAAGGGGCHRPSSEGRGDTLTLTELCFSPTVLRVPPGTRVTIVNRDQLDHPLSRPGGAWSWAGGARDRTAVRLEASGVYPFFCYVHTGMVGVVVVGDGSGSGGATTVDVAARDEAPTPAAASGPVEASVPPAGWSSSPSRRCSARSAALAWPLVAEAGSARGGCRRPGWRVVSSWPCSSSAASVGAVELVRLAVIRPR